MTGWIGSATRDWAVAGLAAFRSGLPFSVLAAAPLETQMTLNRADLIDPNRAAADEPVPGGRRLLNAEAFAVPTAGVLGNTGRNAFRAPGFYNADLSVSRTFPVSERLRAVFRADFFNALNHANAGSPNPFLTDPGFGVSRYGRTGISTGFPAAFPFQETARRIQLMLRLEF